MAGGAVAGSEFDAVLARKGEMGFRGLLKNPRSLLLALFASLGGVLYGYNQGVFGSVQVMEEFVHRYSSTVSIVVLELFIDIFIDTGQMQDTNKTRLAMLTAILELGAFVGAFFAGPISDRYSRKYSISGWCVVFCIGVVVQVSATYDVGFIFGELRVLRCGTVVPASSYDFLTFYSWPLHCGSWYWRHLHAGANVQCRVVRPRHQG